MKLSKKFLNVYIVIMKKYKKRANLLVNIYTTIRNIYYENNNTRS